MSKDEVDGRMRQHFMQCVDGGGQKQRVAEPTIDAADKNARNVLRRKIIAEAARTGYSDKPTADCAAGPSPRVFDLQSKTDPSVVDDGGVLELVRHAVCYKLN